MPATEGRAAEMSKARRAPSVRPAASSMADHAGGSPSPGPAPVSKSQSRVSWPRRAPTSLDSPGWQVSAARVSTKSQCLSIVPRSAPSRRRPISINACCDISCSAGLLAVGAVRLTRTSGRADGRIRVVDPASPRNSSQARSRSGTGLTASCSDIDARSRPSLTWPIIVSR
jgi:hypothetical protein